MGETRVQVYSTKREKTTKDSRGSDPHTAIDEGTHPRHPQKRGIPRAHTVADEGTPRDPSQTRETPAPTDKGNPQSQTVPHRWMLEIESAAIDLTNRTTKSWL